MATQSKDNKSLFGGGGRGSTKEEPSLKRADNEIVHQMDQVEKDLNELKAQYELYFMGVEKLEPLTPRDQIKAAIRRLHDQKPRNTAVKFRIQQLKARVISLENYWTRVTRQREAGLYKRDKARVQRRELELAQALEKQALERAEAPTDGSPPAAPPGVDLPSRTLRGQAEALASGHSPARGGPQPVSRPTARSAEDLTEPKLRRLYQTYMSARKRCGESADLRYEDMASALRKQVPKLMNETGAKEVEFKVVIRSGKAVLKALPKHD